MKNKSKVENGEVRKITEEILDIVHSYVSLDTLEMKPVEKIDLIIQQVIDTAVRKETDKICNCHCHHMHRRQPDCFLQCKHCIKHDLVGNNYCAIHEKVEFRK